MNSYTTGWSTSLSQKTILFILMTYIAAYLAFPGKIYGIEWMVSAIIILIIIINAVYHLSRRWEEISEKKFIRRLFFSALIIRVLIMFILLIISYQTWDMFFYVGAKDEMVYFRVASEASVLWKNFGITEAYNHILFSYRNEISDTGFSFFLAALMVIFGQSPILIKIILCFIGSIAVVRGYKLTTLLFDKPTSRLAAIFLLLYPISWYYSVIMLKEGLMVLLLIEAIIAIVKIQQSFTIKSLIKVLIFIIVIFFFRSAISILLVMVLGFSIFLQRKRTHIIYNVLVAIIVFGVYFYFLKSTGRYDEYYEQYTETEEFFEQRMTQVENINPFVTLAGAPVYTVLALVGPFPSIVVIPIPGDLSHNEYYYVVAGNIFWIILAFFSIYGLYYAIRFKRKELAPLWAFILGYQFILLKAVMFTSVRFSYPAKPFLLIMAAYGIYQLKNKKWYPLYLVGAMVIILGWNYVRLKGRG